MQGTSTAQARPLPSTPPAAVSSPAGDFKASPKFGISRALGLTCSGHNYLQQQGGQRRTVTCAEHTRKTLGCLLRPRSPSLGLDAFLRVRPCSDKGLCQFSRRPGPPVVLSATAFKPSEKPGASKPRPQASVEKCLLWPMALHQRSVDTVPLVPRVCWAVTEGKHDPPGRHRWLYRPPSVFCLWAGSLGKTGKFLLSWGP